VVLDLVVEPAMHEVIRIRARLEIGRANHGAQVEFVALDLDRRFETVDVLSRVIWHHDCKRVDIREDF